MKIFISHASKDASIVRQLADQLVAAGHSVWIPENEFFPGDNWAKKLGQAIEDADTIIVLVTPEAAGSESITREVQYALTADHIKGRVIPVFIGPENKNSADVPWILSKLQPLRLHGDKGDWQKVIDKVDTLAS
jgi:hypothetical protein